MSKFAKFMKANKTVKENERHPVTKSLCDEKGQPLEWEFRHITSKENEAIRNACTEDVLVKGKVPIYRPKLDSSKYIQQLIIASVVSPDLLDEELQNSYGVKKEGDLLMAMVDDPGEYNDLATYVQEFQGFKTFEEEVKEAKKLIDEGDWEANYAYYALHQLHILPSGFLEMDRQDKAFVIAAVQAKMESEQKKEQEISKKNRKEGDGNGYDPDSN